MKTLAAQASRSAAGQLLTIFFLTLVIVPKLFAKVNLTQSTFPFQVVNLFATLRTINILCRSITRGSFTRKISPVIFILIITGLAKVSSADRTIDGSEELPKSLHFIDHTLNSDLVYL